MLIENVKGRGNPAVGIKSRNDNTLLQFLIKLLINLI